ncbi:MAG: riboflavin synthase [Gemmatimonadetes bacterium]|nr:riboflavin synthase [Gemmatimonadota bacterium]MDA1104718.1 riboflavin synthase [Gemmatimonadota bacterium]
MFSGIVESTGRIHDIVDGATTRRLHVEAEARGAGLALGQSVAVDGACLTITELHDGGFSVDVIGTTLARTIAGSYVEGSRVNLERARTLGDRLDGHLVQGHVDGIGHLIQIVKSGEFWLMDFALPLDVHAQTIGRGSITLNGVSLTVSELLPESGVRIGVIPFTHEHTNLGDLLPGSVVNVEGDLIGKYVGRILAHRAE